jgi:hypothetical protein
MTKRAKKRIAARNKSRGGGRHTTAELKERMRSAGYISPAEAMELVGVRGGTIYGWVARDVLKSPPGDDRKPWIRSPTGSNVWLLRDAVLAMRPDPIAEPSS